jgi:hypothetical protein
MYVAPDVISVLFLLPVCLCLSRVVRVGTFNICGEVCISTGQQWLSGEEVEFAVSWEMIIAGHVIDECKWMSCAECAWVSRSNVGINMMLLRGDNHSLFIIRLRAYDLSLFGCTKERGVTCFLNRIGIIPEARMVHFP